MNILIILKKREGGVGSIVQSISEILEQRGHTVKVISREDDLKIFSSIKSIKVLRNIVKNFKKENPNGIIYTQDWSLALPLLFPTKLYQKSHFCCFHGIQPGKSKIAQKIIGKILGNKLIVVGHQLRKKFPKSNLIYNGINLLKFKPLKTKKIKNSLGFVNWKTNEYNFNKIKSAALKSRKKFMVAEKIKKEKMPLFYSKLDEFISLPPNYTGFGLAWIEAMACGVKKIVGNNNGIGSELPITKVDNYSGISEALEKAESKDYRTWLIKNKIFDTNENAKKIESVLKGGF